MQKIPIFFLFVESSSSSAYCSLCGWINRFCGAITINAVKANKNKIIIYAIEFFVLSLAPPPSLCHYCHCRHHDYTTFIFHFIQSSIQSYRCVRKSTFFFFRYLICLMLSVWFSFSFFPFFALVQMRSSSFLRWQHIYTLTILKGRPFPFPFHTKCIHCICTM